MQIADAMLNHPGKPKERKRALLAAFIDFRKAFDSLPHKYLALKLEKMGLTGRLLQVISSLFKQGILTLRANLPAFIAPALGSKNDTVAFADDFFLLALKAAILRPALKRLAEYCLISGLTVN
ncbi:hypothetical protein HDU93_006426, partial [Gonapodya sp. JEL0774]